MPNLWTRLLPEQSDGKLISYGQLIEIMILNGLGFVGRTLHMYPQYFKDRPVERLIGKRRGQTKDQA